MKQLLYLTVFFVFFSCRKDVPSRHADESVNGAKSVAGTSADYGLVWIGNGEKIQVFDGSSSADWNGTPHFDFQLNAARGYSSSDISNWEGVTDFKVRHMPVWGGNWMVASGGSLAIVAAYPSGQKRWSYAVGSGVNPHSAELLPTGNVAVAGTDGEWVRVYAASVGAYNYASYSLPKAHSVLWDPAINKLWAIGLDHLVSLTVGGTSSPTISQSEKITLPKRAEEDNAWGHDLSFDPLDSNIIWFSTNSGVYKFNKTTKAITNGPAYVHVYSVKGISRQANGNFVITRPDGAKNPMPSDPVTSPTWCTRYVDFLNSSGAKLYSKKRTGAVIYKGKVLEVTPPPAPIADGKYKIVSKLDANKVIAIQNASTSVNASAVLWDYTSTNPNDEWNITQIGTTGYYRITNVNSNLDLVVEDASFQSGAHIIQHVYTSANPVNDEWSIESVGSGYYRIVSRFSGKVLNVEGGTAINGTQIIIYPYANSSNSQWTLTSIP